jgi:hypothetical protein
MEMTASEPLTSATPAIENDPGTPKLIVQSSRGVSGEPAPIGLALRAGAKGITVESKVEPEITNSTCFASASAVRQDKVEVEMSQCLDRRIPNKQILIDEIAAWEHDRNANHTRLTGNSPPKMLASNLSIYTLQSD